MGMPSKRVGVLGAVVAATLIAAPVQAACWTAESVAAAKIRDLQSMLMVATLRCQVAGFDIAGDYNAYINANRTVIGETNAVLKRLFAASADRAEAMNGYDAFTTKLANAYGNGKADSAACANAAATAQEGVAMANSIDGLLLVAERNGIDTQVPGGSCGMTFASVPDDLLPID